MMMKSFLCRCLIASFLVVVSLSNQATVSKNKSDNAGKNKPNIIFILTDDLGYGDVGAFFQKQLQNENKRNNPWHATPHLDRLAESGVQLTQMYCNAPVCAPSRTSLLMGVHQGHANVRDNQFDKALEDNYTLGNVMQRLGYSTVAIGKWGLQGDDRWEENGSEWPAFPLNRGFDDFFGYIRHGDGHEHYPKEGLYRGSKKVFWNREEISQQLDKCYTGDLWTAYAKKWIVDHSIGDKSEEPFFMFLAYDTPHAVLELPTQAYPEGEGLNGGLQWIGKAGNMINTASGKIDSWTHPDYVKSTYDHDNNPSTKELPWPDTYKRYATSVRRIDDGIGDLRQLLKDLNILENTIIVFSSDNGPTNESYLPNQYVSYEPTFFNSFGPFDGIKRDCWEGGVRMPVLVSWPGIIQGNKVIDTPGMLSDWMATFCEAAGSFAPARSDGVSLLSALTGKGIQNKGVVYIEYFQKGKTPKYEKFESGRQGRSRNQMQLIRLGDYVGVRYDIQSHGDDFEIYDVVSDAKETTNLAENHKMSSLQKQMKDKVLQIRRPNPSAPRPYDNELVPSVNIQKTIAGAAWSLYKNPTSWIPDTKSLTAEDSGNTNYPEVSILNHGNGDLILFEGYFNIPSDGDFTFYLKADGAALLRIHEAMVIDADYAYEPMLEKQSSIKLKAGLHPFKLYYSTKNKETKPALELSWSGPGFEKEIIPENIFIQSN